MSKEAVISIWRFDDAPIEMQRMSTNGGDEDWIILFPVGMTEDNMPWEFDKMVRAMAVCDADYHTIDGRLFAITCHA